MKTMIAAAAALLALGAGAAEAAGCTTSQIGGTWLVILNGDVTCVMETSTAGNISRGNCYALASGVAAGTLSGFFAVKKTCAVTGTFIQTAGKKRIEASFKGEIDKTAAGLTGVATTKQTKAVLIGLKQW